MTTIINWTTNNQIRTSQNITYRWLSSGPQVQFDVNKNKMSINYDNTVLCLNRLVDSDFSSSSNTSCLSEESMEVGLIKEDALWRLMV